MRTKIVLLLVVFVLAACSSTKQEEPVLRESVAVEPTVPVVPVPEPMDAKVERLVAEATSVCAGPAPPVPVGRKLVLLCAHDRTDRFHRVTLALPETLPRTYERCVVRHGTRHCTLPIDVLTDGYRFEHVGGFGPVRFRGVLSTHDGEPLIVYRARHMRSYDDSAYSPPDPALVTAEYALLGYEYLQREIREAFALLTLKSVRSRAYPDRLIGEVVPRELIVKLVLAEQSDDRAVASNPTSAYHTTLAHFPLNRSETFGPSVSSAFALGALQFTDKNGNGTYSLVRRLYPEAELIENFAEGARNVRNAIMAAALLIDYELADFAPARATFLDGPHSLGTRYVVAAYNCGGGCARRFFARWIRGRVGGNAETRGYLVKLNYAIAYLKMLREERTATTVAEHTCSSC